VTGYYHGGVTGLRPGDALLPPSVTGSDSLHEPTTEEYGEDRNPHRPDRVYVTTSIEWAWFYALDSGTRGTPPRMVGAVYRVDPASLLEGDPDQPMSFACTSATVRSVLDAEVSLTRENADKAKAFLARCVADE
jgi:hypothetical protein